MKIIHIFAVILICASSVLAQNCSTQLVMNTVNIASGNSIVASGTTMTVTLANAWTNGSGTGYATVYIRSGSLTSFGGSYKILSGNGTGADGSVGATSITLDQTTRTTGAATASGSTSGFYISDVGVIKNSGRSYTIVWTTPGFNSTSNLSYGDDADTTTLFAYGYNWIHQDTVTGVTNHSITISNLDSTVSDNIGKYFFTVWSECFTGGMPDRTIGAALPNVIGGAANQGNSSSYDQMIQTPVQGDYQLGLDTFTLQGYNGASTGYVVVPQQDGTHPGFRGSPGGVITLGLYVFDDINPTTNLAGAGDNGASIVVEDWNGAGTGLLSLGKNGNVVGGATPAGAWAGGNITIRHGSGGGALNLTIPANAPTTGTGCTNLMGTPLTLDDGTAACAYALSLTTKRWFSSASYTCGTQITCGPTGTPAMPLANLPYVGKVWVIVFNAPAVSQGTVGPWMNPYTGMPGIPCERNANKSVDKPASSLPVAGCQNQTSGITSVSGGLFTFDTNEQNNCEFVGLVNENTYTITSTPMWFYDNPYVCHVIDTLYPQAGGLTNDSYEKHILGIYWQQSGYPRTVEAHMIGAYAVSAPATATNYPFCTQYNRDANCATLTIPVGTTDVSAIAAGLAAGIRYRACINQDNPTGNLNLGGYSYGCYVFPQNTPNVTPVSAAGGNISAPATVQMLIYYTASPLNVYSYTIGSKSVTISSTCPTSGNCSVTVPSPPQVTNAIGYDVYARVSGVGNYYRQNTAGPVPIGTAFTFGTTANPFLNSGYALPVGYGNQLNGAITNVLAADNVAHTITIDTQQGLGANPSNTNNATIFIMRQVTGITADATSNTSTVVCASCDFTAWDGYKGVPTWATVYCGVTDTGSLGPFPNYALYSLAPQRGSTIAANGIDVPNHTIHLATPINCGPGVNFEIRQEGTLAGNNRIFLWPRGSYDVWKRFGNYVGADAVMWLAQDTNPPGSSFSPPNGGVSYIWTRRRESSLAVMGCQMALHLLNDLSTSGNTTALSPAVICQSPSTANNRLNGLFSMVDTMVNGNRGRGVSIGSFLDGLILNAIINWWLDPMMGVQSNTSYLYWAKRLTDTLWNTYYNAKGSFIPSICQPLYPHEYPYDIESQLVGLCVSNGINWWPNGYGVGSAVPVADYWSIYGNIYPAFAFFYAYTGNATIPNSNPPTTYGQAYADMASWGFVHMASMNGWINSNAGLKTLGEMGIWQDQALGWMTGSTGIVVPPPTPLTITTSSLPAGTVGVPYAASVTATGGTAPYTWTSTGLPSGLTMNTSGNISGSPLTAGTSSPSFTVTDSVSATASTSLSVTITAAPPPPLVITTNSLPSGTVGIAYSASLTATGGTPPYTWTQVGLPSGLVMNSSGDISGTPLVAGNVTPQFTVTDAASATTSTSLSLAIAPAAAPSNAPGFTPPIISERRGGSDRIGLSN